MSRPIAVLSLLLSCLLAACNATAPSRAAADAPRAAGAAQIVEIARIADIESTLDALPADDTLVVFDIDDTLLTSVVFFGSDRWFEWQSDAATPAQYKPACPFDVIALNYEAGTQRPVEGEASVAFFNAVALPKLLLTSRGAHYRGATERELIRAGFELPKSLADDEPGWLWQDGAPGATRPISYARGIQMVTGRDKGAMLLELLQRTGRRFGHVVLVDDGRRNIDSLASALPPAGIDYHGFHYLAVPKPRAPDGKLVVTAAEAQEAADGLAAWNALLRVVFPERAERWDASPATCGP